MKWMQAQRAEKMKPSPAPGGRWGKIADASPVGVI